VVCEAWVTFRPSATAHVPNPFHRNGASFVPSSFGLCSILCSFDFQINARPPPQWHVAPCPGRPEPLWLSS
jgi:hypothetical protein